MPHPCNTGTNYLLDTRPGAPRAILSAHWGQQDMVLGHDTLVTRLGSAWGHASDSFNLDDN